MATHEAYLRTALGKYRYADITKRDVLNVLGIYKDLRPKLDSFVYNDGSRKELLCLDGTIPVGYKGSTYNIPVCIWLTDTHPYNPPMAYVKPTSSMQIKAGKHVDQNGKVYLPYMHEWKHPASDLLGLIQILVIVFGEEPPVFARSATQPPARPPYPAAGPPAGNLPYPTAGGGMPTPNYPPSTSAYPQQRPPYPPQTQQAGGYPGFQQPYPLQQPYPANQQYPGFNPPYPSQQSFGAQTAAAAVATSAVSRQGSMKLSDEQIKASLLSAVEDKMKRRLREIFAQAQAEMDALKRTQEDLNKGKNTLEDMLQKLEKEQNEVERNITLLQEKDGEIKEVLSRMENREEVNIDEAVVPAAPLYRQLLSSFAEEQATEDAIYYLGEGLRKGVLDLDVFLKQVRELSRKQFMLRALIHKCRTKAGLPDLSSQGL